MTKLKLSVRDEELLAGAAGEAARVAMRLVVKAAQVTGAPHLIDVAGAHIDGCLFHGRAGLDFAQRLAEGGGEVVVPTTLNVSSLDLLHPHLYRGSEETRALATDLMDAYVALGCRPTWTCAPYQLPERPAAGQDIAWGESNAIVFANSVLGARTNRYGDFLDIAAALTGRVPYAGLHVPAERAARVVFRVEALPEDLLHEDVAYPVLGHLVGREAGTLVAAIDGLPAEIDEDRLKALGAAAASSGGVALVHVVGVTPEAASLEDALQGRAPERVVDVTPEMFAAARAALSTAGDGAELNAVSIGTPHASLAEIDALAAALSSAGAARIPLYVSTGRDVLARAEQSGIAERCRAAGVSFVTDTCTYITPILDPEVRVVMTNSAKWAYYAPGNLGVDVVFGSLGDCVRSAVEGSVVRDESVWHGA